MPISQHLADAIVDSFLGGVWTPSELLSRATALFAVERPRDWLLALALRVVATFPDTAPRPTARHLKQFVIKNIRFGRVRSFRPPTADLRITIRRRAAETRLKRQLPTWTRSMQPAAGPPSQWAVPEIVSIPQLADWLGITIGELDWFADRAGWGSDSPHEQLRHYRYQWISKPSGGFRLLESPKPRLKQMQRRILDEILNRVPPHPAAHAFRTGRSIASYVAPHAGRHAILHIDLREFFPSVPASRVHAAFRMMGYPERVASLLTGLCTTSTPSRILEEHRRRVDDEGTWLRHRSPHLPQGAPTSPALANLCAHRLDARLVGLARSVSAEYTRYADDLVISGDREFAKCLLRLRILINAIVLDEGFEIRQRKTHVMIRGTRQQISGIRLNQQPNIPRETYDELKAILHNCRRYGPASQNHAGHPHFRQHLEGRLSYWSAICPERIAKLKRMLDEIDWREN